MRLNKNSWLLNKPIAHRGLWGDGIIENSLPAYQNAIDNGYPIEVDVYSSLDGEIFCFHDENLFRMTGVNKNIYSLSASQIKELNLLESEQKIPTFDELLHLASGKVPLLIEIKNQPDSSVVDKVITRLLSYKGEFAIQSFNPLYIKRVKKLAPHFIRGILGSSVFYEKLPFYKRVLVKNMPFNFIIKPDFISYNYLGLPLKNKNSKNLPVIAWTITDLNDYKKAKEFCSNVIFEKINLLDL